MQTNSLFSYNLPSIPGKPIRLRIQYVPKAGFSSKIPRNSQNYSKMAQSFISEYSNLKSKRAQSVSHQTDTSTRASATKKQQPECWYIIPQHKGVLINLYQQQSKEIKRQFNNPNVALRKRDNISKKLYAKFIKQKNDQKSMYEQILKEQYHKAWEQEARKKENKKMKNSSCFLSEPRSKSKMQKQPKIQEQQDEEEYEIGQNILLLEDCQRLQQQSQQPDDQEDSIGEPILKMEDLKEKTTDMLKKLNIKKKQMASNSLQQIYQQESIPSYMFIKDDRDRFGKQLFPVVAKVNNPGPGTYNEKNTMQNKAKRVKLLEQQRKILKQWFND